MAFQQQKKMYPGMWQYSKYPDRCCIYRVPNRLHEINPEAYTPQAVLIGPLHHSLKFQALKALDRGDDITYTKSMSYLNMEEHKKFYLAEFTQKVEGEKTIEGFKRMIEEEEERIRESYSESTAWIKSQEFVDMVLHDSVFIIELMLRYCEGSGEKIGDPLMDEISLGETVFHDLLMLENQLPYFIIEKLFGPLISRILPDETLRKLIMEYFMLEGKIKNDSKFRHFTDLFRCVCVETLPRDVPWKAEPREHMYNAYKLYNGGLKFEDVGEKSLRVKFENGCLKMTRLRVDDKLEIELRNIMALEQCHYPFRAYVCNYVAFLDRLIDTEKDVNLLVKKGIIQNGIGRPALVVQMVNELRLGIAEVNSPYWDIELHANEYYKTPVNRFLTDLKTNLKGVYFPNKWKGTATIAAMILLVMTLMQTVASIIQAKPNKF